MHVCPLGPRRDRREVRELSYPPLLVVEAAPLLEVAGTVPVVPPVPPFVPPLAVPLVEPGCVGVVVEVGAGSGFVLSPLLPLLAAPPLAAPAPRPLPPVAGSVGSESVSGGGCSLEPPNA